MKAPAPDVIMEAMCSKCQSVAQPSRALYWHIGEMTSRLRSVRPRSVSGWNGALVRGSAEGTEVAGEAMFEGFMFLR